MKALVTGAAREGGIGRAIVARLEADGMEVVTIDKDPGCTWQADLAHDPLPDLSDIDVLVGEFAQPEDIAEAVAFFASPAARRITGQELTVDAGDRLNTPSTTGSVARTDA